MTDDLRDAGTHSHAAGSPGTGGAPHAAGPPDAAPPHAGSPGIAPPHAVTPEVPAAVRARYEHAMSHALSLAANGPVTGGNPQVGCLLLDDAGNAIAEGWHRGAGTPHAEVDAISQLGTRRPHTAIVSLEPCNHTGRTGPCALALIEAGVQRVVYAVADPGASSGGGAQRLRAAGVEIIDGVLADEVARFLQWWLVAQRRGRPWTTVKWASTLDGRAAAADGTSQWITGPEARTDGHRLRADSDAILTGTGTVLADDPSLTARAADGTLLAHQPRPIVVGDRAVPPHAKLRDHPAGLIEAGSADLADVLRGSYDRGELRVLVEAGPTLTSAMLREGLADELQIYLAPALLGGPGLAIGDLGLQAIGDAMRLELLDVRRLGTDLALTARPLVRQAAADSGEFGSKRAPAPDNHPTDLNRGSD